MRRGKARGTSTFAVGTQKPKRKNGKKLAFSHWKPQATPITAYKPAKKATRHICGCCTVYPSTCRVRASSSKRTPVHDGCFGTANNCSRFNQHKTSTINGISRPWLSSGDFL